MKARVVAYKGKLICELLVNKSDDDVATSIDTPGNLGQVICRSDINVGMSKEAVELLKQIKPGRDAIGSVDWFESVKGNVFAWFGGPKAVIDPADAVAARGYQVRDSYVKIPNDVPEDAKAYVDSM
jgi:hypothetical protein